MVSSSPPFKCLYCLKDRNEVSFTTIEHVIPESLGNHTKFVLSKGYMCDGCQKYFGGKIEQQVLSHPLVTIQRVNSGIPSKSGRPAKYKRDFLEVYWDDAGKPTYKIHERNLLNALKDGRVKVTHNNGEVHLRDTFTITEKDSAFTRFLLKMSLGLLALYPSFVNPQTNQIHNYGPYGENFHKARNFARNPKTGECWSIWIQEVNQEQLRGQKGWEENKNEFFNFISDGSVIFHYRFGVLFLACNLLNPNLDYYSEILREKYAGSRTIIQTRI